MSVPTNYRMSDDPMLSCATCEHYNKVVSSCNKFVTYVDKGAVCDALKTMNQKQSEAAATIRRITSIVKKAAGLPFLARTVNTGMSTNSKIDKLSNPDSLTAAQTPADVLSNVNSGAGLADTAVNLTSKVLPVVSKFAPAAEPLATAAPLLGRFNNTMGKVLGPLGAGVMGAQALEMVGRNPNTGELGTADMAGNVRANADRAMTESTGRGTWGNAVAGFSNSPKAIGSAAVGLADLGQERNDQRAAQENIARQTEQLKQKRYEISREKAYAAGPSRENIEAQKAALRAKRSPVPAPAPAQKFSVPVPDEQPAAPKPTTPPPPPKSQPVTQTPQPKPRALVSPVKAAQHTRACACGRVSDTYYDICPVCQPVLDAKAAAYLRGIAKRIKAAAAPTVKQVDAAAAKADKKPTEDQKESGNYKKGHIKMHGMDITIENPKGSTRSGESKDGKKWSVLMKSHYGYIKQTESEADGDHVDVLIGPDPKSFMVYVIDQVNPKTGAFDEHKCVLGCKSEKEARALYLANYEKGWKGLGGVKFMIIPQFKRWLDKGDTGKPVTKRASDYRSQ